jgi:hypothetical protein
VIFIEVSVDVKSSCVDNLDKKIRVVEKNSFSKEIILDRFRQAGTKAGVDEELGLFDMAYVILEALPELP